MSLIRAERGGLFNDLESSTQLYGLTLGIKHRKILDNVKCRNSVMYSYL